MVALVKDAAARLGYIPNPAAQMTATGSSPLIGMISDRLRDGRVGALSVGVVEAADSMGLTVMMSSGSTAGDDTGKALQTMIGFRPRAIIIASRRDREGAFSSDPIVARYAETGGRLVWIGARTPESWLPGVRLDDEGGSRELSAAILKSGRKQVVILSTGPSLPAMNARGLLLRDALSEGGIDALVLEAGDVNRDAAFLAISSFFTSRQADLVAAVSDELAIGVIAALRDRDIVPGGEVAVTGFDDLPEASEMIPALTTVRTHLREAGRKAVLLGLGMVREELWPVPATLMIRESFRPF